MEEAPGEQLESAWNKLPSSDKISIMKQLVDIEARLSSTSFSQYAFLSRRSILSY